MRTWFVWYLLTDGSRHRMSTKSLEDAKCWHARLIRSHAVTECWLASPRGNRAEVVS